MSTTPQPGTPSPATGTQTPHDTQAKSATQQAMDFLHAILTNDTQTVNAQIQSGETHIVSLGLDFVPPTYRAKVQPFVDNIVNSTQPAVLTFADREIGIGLAIAKARLGGFLGLL